MIIRMNSGGYAYIWQAGDWPNWHFDLGALAGPMAEVSRAQGLLMGVSPMSAWRCAIRRVSRR
jgi:Fic family protein